MFDLFIGMLSEMSSYINEYTIAFIEDVYIFTDTKRSIGYRKNLLEIKNY